MIIVMTMVMIVMKMMIKMKIIMIIQKILMINSPKTLVMTTTKMVIPMEIIVLITKNKAKTHIPEKPTPVLVIPMRQRLNLQNPSQRPPMLPNVLHQISQLIILLLRQWLTHQLRQHLLLQSLLANIPTHTMNY